MCMSVFFLYAETFYHALPAAEAALAGNEAVLVEKTEYGWFFDGPSEEDCLIFYPGGKVEETAYAPFLRELAQGGLDVCLVKMPFRLAVLDIQAADRVLSEYTYEHWYIGGHSLGGAMAAYYASEKNDRLCGIILCAAYMTKNTDSDLIGISIYGSEDSVMDRKKLEKGRQYYPERTDEYVIEGGNHAQFGEYGVQKGDGTARITGEAQRKQAAECILDTLCRYENGSD